MTRDEAARSLTIEYQRQREENERALDGRRAKAIGLDPRIGELLSGEAGRLRDAVRLLLSDPERAGQAMQEAKARTQADRQELARRLKEAGLAGDYLEMTYRCPVCKDTGFVGSPLKRHCDCFVKRLNERMYEDAGLTGRTEQSFETFDEQFVPDEPVEGLSKTQRQIALEARDRCRRYADRYPDTPRPGLLLMGPSGLGKTFLMNCVARRLIGRGFSPVRMTAYRLFDLMRGACMGDEAKYREFSRLLDEPILMVDDMGSEPMMRNITVEYWFTLINERSSAGKHTVIATNLSQADLAARYTERIASRMLDRAGFEAIGLAGRDLRLLPRRNP